MPKHVCENRFRAEGARGGSFFEIEACGEGAAHLRVGHSCAIVFDKKIPITWLAEIIAIASEHKNGMEGFLCEHDWSGDSYALMCDPSTVTTGEM